LREKHILNLFENRFLRTVFGSKRDEVRGDWRSLHNEEFHDLYFSQYEYIMRVTKSRRIKWAGNVARMMERRIACRVGKPEGKKPS
jgi:hypothetical protein